MFIKPTSYNQINIHLYINLRLEFKLTVITGVNVQFGYLHHQLIYPNKMNPQF